MGSAVEADVDPSMKERLAAESLAQPHFREQVDGALLEHACAHCRLDLLSRAGVHDHRIDAVTMKQVREQQSGGPGADDADLGLHGCSMLHGVFVEANAQRLEYADL